MVIIIDNEEGYLEYVSELFFDDLDEILKYLKNDLKWEKEYFNFGNGVTSPKRLRCQNGDKGVTYRYSRTVKHANGWDPLILAIKETVEKQLNKSFNFCLMQYYPDGDAYISYHSDDERDLVDNSLIIGISFGEERRIFFKHKTTGERTTLTLENGSMFVMGGKLQEYYKHSIPKEKNKGPRISLTLRSIQTQ
jgi:alkylated DNA repair dioxygenase AlkB